jgi:hypothetical protein
MTITMLGFSKSGKSTYVLGAYEELVHGAHGCFLHTADHNAGVEMIRSLNALRSGKTPPPTSDKPVSHEFVLTRSGSTEQTAIDLIDFRGGAAFDVARGKDGDTAQLHRRLVESDAIFLFLDSSHFSQPVTPGRLQAAREATGADRFADMIGKAVSDRQLAGRYPPAVVILLSKADLIDGRPGSVERDWDELESEVHMLMGSGAFQPHLGVRIFPVSVGGFSTSPNGESSAVKMDVRSTANPVIFAAGCFLWACRLRVQQQQEQATAACTEARERLQRLTRWWPLIQQWFLRSQIAVARAALDRANDHVTALDARLAELSKQAQALLDSF